MLAEGGVGPWESSLATGTYALLEVQKALPVKNEQNPEATLVKKTSRCKGG